MDLHPPVPIARRQRSLIGTGLTRRVEAIQSQQQQPKPIPIGISQEDDEDGKKANKSFILNNRHRHHQRPASPPLNLTALSKVKRKGANRPPSRSSSSIRKNSSEEVTLGGHHCTAREDWIPPLPSSRSDSIPPQPLQHPHPLSTNDHNHLNKNSNHHRHEDRVHRWNSASPSPSSSLSSLSSGASYPSSLIPTTPSSPRSAQLTSHKYNNNNKNINYELNEHHPIPNSLHPISRNNPSYPLREHEQSNPSFSSAIIRSIDVNTNEHRLHDDYVFNNDKGDQAALNRVDEPDLGGKWLHLNRNPFPASPAHNPSTSHATVSQSNSPIVAYRHQHHHHNDESGKPPTHHHSIYGLAQLAQSSPSVRQQNEANGSHGAQDDVADDVIRTLNEMSDISRPSSGSHTRNPVVQSPTSPSSKTKERKIAFPSHREGDEINLDKNPHCHLTQSPPTPQARRTPFSASSFSPQEAINRIKTVKNEQITSLPLNPINGHHRHARASDAYVADDGDESCSAAAALVLPQRLVRSSITSNQRESISTSLTPTSTLALDADGQNQSERVTTIRSSATANKGTNDSMGWMPIMDVPANHLPPHGSPVQCQSFIIGQGNEVEASSSGSSSSTTTDYPQLLNECHSNFLNGDSDSSLPIKCRQASDFSNTMVSTNRNNSGPSTRRLISQVNPIQADSSNPMLFNDKPEKDSIASPPSLSFPLSSTSSSRNIRIVDVQLKDPNPSDAHLKTRPTNQITQEHQFIKRDSPLSNNEVKGHIISRAPESNVTGNGLSSSRMHSKSMENLISLYEHLSGERGSIGSTGPSAPNQSQKLSVTAVNSAPSPTIINTKASSKRYVKSSPFITTSLIDTDVENSKANKERYNNGQINEISNQTTDIEDHKREEAMSEARRIALGCWSQFLPVLPVIGTPILPETNQDDPILNNDKLIKDCDDFVKNETEKSSAQSHMSDEVGDTDNRTTDGCLNYSSGNFTDGNISSNFKSNQSQSEYDSIFKSKYESLRERYARERRLWTERTERERERGAQVDHILRQLQDTLFKSKQQLSDMKDKLDNSPSKGCHSSLTGPIIGCVPSHIRPLRSISVTTNYSHDGLYWQEIMRLCNEVKQLIINSGHGDRQCRKSIDSAHLNVDELNKAIKDLHGFCELKVKNIKDSTPSPTRAQNLRSLSPRLLSIKQAMASEEKETISLRRNIQKSQDESKKLVDEMKGRIAVVSSVEDAKALEAIQTRLELTQKEVRNLNEKLRESHANYDYLELAYRKLEHELVSLNTRHASEEDLMRQRIDYLTSRLCKSEKSLSVAKHHLARYELTRKSFLNVSESGQTDIILHKERRRSRAGQSLDRNHIVRGRLSTVGRNGSSVEVERPVNIESQVQLLEKKVDRLYALLSLCAAQKGSKNRNNSSGQLTPDGSVTSDLGSSSSVATSGGSVTGLLSVSVSEECTTASNGGTGSGLSSPDGAAPLIESQEEKGRSRVESSEEQDRVDQSRRQNLWKRVNSLEERFESVERGAMAVMPPSCNRLVALKPTAC